MPRAQIVKWGNSLAVRIPKAVAAEVGVAEGDPITVEAGRGHIRLQTVERVPTLKELVGRITPKNRYAEIRTGRARGREAVEW
ncbi:MAG TPA: AbrB/MazE/SpoVT family DNA-binding domain-containing protein [Terriglobales bacterium]